MANPYPLQFHYDFLTSYVVSDPEFFTKKVPYMKAAGVKTVWLDNYVYGAWQNSLEDARRAKAMGKALILALHVPIHVETLVEDTVRVWKRELTIGEGAFGADDPATMAFYNAVTEESDLAPDMVIAGHVHFDHEDVFPNGIPQYITDIACGGHCRVLTLIPAESR